jgi:DsbC/DsbD-like thiol-disulfide interchange protein
MAKSPRSAAFAVTLVLLGCCGFAPPAAASDDDHPVEAALVADVRGVVPGEQLRLGVRLRMQPGWHTYWRNPGDAGDATTITWELPGGWYAGPLRWPVPERIVEPGELVVYGYRGEVLLFADVTPPDDLQPGDRVELRAKVRWLVCEHVCLPGDAQLSLALPVVAQPDAAHAEAVGAFDRSVANVPLPSPEAAGIEVAQRLEGSLARGAIWRLRFTLPGGLGAAVMPERCEGAELGEAEILVLKDLDDASGRVRVEVRIPVKRFAGAEPPRELAAVVVLQGGARPRAFSARLPLGDGR